MPLTHRKSRKRQLTGLECLHRWGDLPTSLPLLYVPAQREQEGQGGEDKKTGAPGRRERDPDLLSPHLGAAAGRLASPQLPWEGRSPFPDQGPQLHPPQGSSRGGGDYFRLEKGKVKTGLRQSKVSAYFLLRLSRAKRANVYQTYVPGSVGSAFTAAISFKPQEQVGFL